MISAACYKDALEAKSATGFGKGMVDYVTTTFGDEIGDGTDFTDEVTNVKSDPWESGPECFNARELSDALETNLALQVTYCILALLVYRAQDGRYGLNLPDSARYGLGGLGLAVSLGMLVHVVLEHSKELE